MYEVCGREVMQNRGPRLARVLRPSLLPINMVIVFFLLLTAAPSFGRMEYAPNQTIANSSTQYLTQTHGDHPPRDSRDALKGR